MSEAAHDPPRNEQADRLMTVASGWAALAMAILGIHRWLATGTTQWGVVPSDWWARAGMILALGLGIMWIWGFWGEIVTRLRGWVRSGGLNTTLIAVGLIVALVIVNTLARRRLLLKWDLTKNQRFTLSRDTRSLLKKLEKPLKITVYLPGERDVEQARETFSQYAEASDKVSWTRVDSLTHFEDIATKKIRVSGDLKGARLEYSGKTQDITDFTEKDITTAILKLTREGSRKVLFMEGHGELTTDPLETNQSRSMRLLTDDLKDLQWEVDKVSLYGKKAKVPDPAAAPVIVMAGPAQELAADEAKRLNQYLNNGGSLLLLLRATGPSYASFLKPWGIATADDVVLDQEQEQLVVVHKPEHHPAVEQLNRVIFTPMRSVKTISPAPKDVTVAELLKVQAGLTIPGYKPGVPVDPRKGRSGPVTVAVMTEKTLGTGQPVKKARVAVVGDALFTSDLWVQQLSRVTDNRALPSALINYMGGEQELISIPSKDERTEDIFITPSQERVAWLVHIWDFPLLALLLAIIVYLKRR